MKHKLSVKQVENAKPAGKKGGKEYWNDGGGLYLQVRKSGHKGWQFRWRDRTTQKLRAMGLGGFPAVKLAQARNAAEDARQVVQSGGSPTLERDKALKEVQDQTHAEENVLSFDNVADEYIAHILAPDCKTGKTAKTVDQWINSLEMYVTPVFGPKPVGEVDTADVLEVLKPIWTTKSETADRIRMRIERIIAYSAAKGYRSPDMINPGIWRGHLDAHLPKKQAKKKRQHFKALPYKKLPKLYGELCEKTSLTALALRFTILTAARTGEVIGAEWKEIDDFLWTVPASRMKAGKKHVVPLPEEAGNIFEELDDSGKYLFPGGNYGKRGGHLSNIAMLNLLKDMRPGITVHGMRSAFRDWAAECTDAQNFVVEKCLAHTVGGVEGAYRRGELLDKRAALMEQWAKFLTN